MSIISYNNNIENKTKLIKKGIDFMKTYLTKNINGITVKVEEELINDTRLNFRDLTLKACKEIISVNSKIVNDNTIRFTYKNPVFENTLCIQAQYDLTGLDNRYLYIEKCEN